MMVASTAVTTIEMADACTVDEEQEGHERHRVGQGGHALGRVGRAVGGAVGAVWAVMPSTHTDKHQSPKLKRN